MSTSAPRRVLPFGETALLVELADLDAVLGLAEALRSAPLAGQVECVPAARTVLVRFASASAAAGARQVLASPDGVVGAADEGGAAGRRGAVGGGGATGQGPVAPGVADGPGHREVVLDVVYDGPDLGDLAAHLGISPEHLVRAHTATPWRAAFGGFAPGFVYLDGSPWDVPRREVPRAAVPPGAVGLAGQFSAVYPRVSPGGWQLVGRTDAVLWDVARPEPALVRPGDVVRFRPVPAPAVALTAAAPPAAAVPPPVSGTGPSAPSGPALVVLDPGPLCLVEDLGRPGHAASGVSRSGAADRASAVRANRLVGNPRGAAVLETLGGLELQAVGPLVVAVAGAPVAVELRTRDGVGDGPVPPGRAVAVPDGGRLVLARPTRGVRSYLAVRGGVEVPPVLGSRSTDVLGGVGPPPVRAGTVLPVGDPAAAGAVALPDDGPWPGHDVVTVRVDPGPRADWVADPATLWSRSWLVDDRSNRVGVRLAGEPLARARDGELASEGMVPGAVQVPPSGLPVVLLADHPVTGGYPVVAVVVAADLDLLAQAAPGTVVRFALR